MAKKQNNRSNAQRTSSASSGRAAARPTSGSNGATATATRPVVKSPASSGVSSNGSVKKAPSAAAQAANERIAAARQRNEAARLAAQRRRALEGGWLRQRWPIVGAFVTVVLLIAIFFTIAHNASSGSASIGNPVPDKILTQITSVSPSVFEKVGKGTIANPFQKVKDTPPPPVNKTADGKPIFLYVGAEYCPYCAAERWSMVVALSRFGAFKDLSLTQSSSTDVYPNTSTFTFNGSSYTSQYLAFQAVETADRNGASLEKPTSDQQAIFAKYDAPPYISSNNAGSIPFLSIGNQYIEISAGFIPDQMNGLTWQQIADKLNDPNNSITQNIVANANYITAAICQITDSKPANVCTAAPIPAIIADMKAGK